MDDSYYLKKALKLAEKGKGMTSPNPMVGAVLVKDGKIIGQGFHQKAGLPHAEIIALRKAKAQVEGSALYINLEPCIHFGRTPPCVTAIIKSGIKKVVASMEDPNPHVNGKGFTILTKHGVEVKVGLLREEAEKLNEAFIYSKKHELPFVLIKAGLTLNGILSSVKGKGEQITGAEAKEYVHQLRKEYDAIMVGVNTIVIDDPQLTCRPSDGKSSPLIRVVLDSKLRTRPQAHIFQAQDGGKTIIFTLKNSPQKKRKELEKAGAEVIEIGEKNGRIDLKAVLKHLNSMEIISLIIEGGPSLITSTLGERLAQKMILIYAPKIFTGRNSLPFINWKMLKDGDNIIQLSRLKILPLGEDIAIEAYLKPNIKT